MLCSEHVSKLSRSDEHELDGFIGLMERTEVTCLAEFDEGDVQDKNEKTLKISDAEMMCGYCEDGGTKPPFKFRNCVKCGHNRTHCPGYNKGAFKENKTTESAYVKKQKHLRGYKRVTFQLFLSTTKGRR